MTIGRTIFFFFFFFKSERQQRLRMKQERQEPWQHICCKVRSVKQRQVEEKFFFLLTQSFTFFFFFYYVMTFYSRATATCLCSSGAGCRCCLQRLVLRLTSLGRRTHYLTCNPHVHSLSAIFILTRVIRNHVTASSGFSSEYSYHSSYPDFKASDLLYPHRLRQLLSVCE